MGGACSSANPVESASQKILAHKSKKNSTFLHVRVNIYEVVGTTANAFISEMKAGSAYISGVEIAGFEYFYGFCKQGTGLWKCISTELPKEHAWKQAIYRQTVDMGMLTTQKEELDGIMEDLHVEYEGAEFHPVEKNWNHFVNDVCKRLTDEKCPQWINKCWVTLAELAEEQPKKKKAIDIMKDTIQEEWSCPNDREPTTERVALHNRTLKKSSSEINFMKMMAEEEKAEKENKALDAAKAKI